MSALKLLLLPFSLAYDFVTRIRNRMYDIKWKPSVEFEIPVLAVGNLAVGGTGKTPMIEYLIRLVSPTYKASTLSRGYRRKTKGFRIATNHDNSSTIGDEPFQLFTKYGDKVIVSVGEDRAFAIPNILDQHPDSQLILLDDAFQHRRVKPGFSILLTEFSNPFYNDYVLPGGRLREHPRGANRADVIVVTKCPHGIGDGEVETILSGIRKYSTKPVYFSAIRYGAPQPMLGNTSEIKNRVVLVSGVANHTPLENFVKSNYQLVSHFTFGDHRHYTKSDILTIEKFVKNQREPVSIITTEKDKVKLESKELQESIANLPFFSIPIEMEFIRSGKEFDALVMEFLNRGK